MLDYSNIQIEKLAVHLVGNKHRGDQNFVSRLLFELNSELETTLLHYFLKPFKKELDQYRFQHPEDLNHNEIYSCARTVFEDSDRFHQQSVNILFHLYKQSDHPNIKSGEIYVVYFRDLRLDGEPVDGMGIFKSEQKNTFLKVTPTGNNLYIDSMEGIHIEKLDKGCLIINTRQDDGFRVMSVDNNKYDALYWPHHFLNIDFVEDEKFHTKLYLEMCNEFSREVIAPQGDRREQVQFMADSVDYFAKHEIFDFNDFTERVLPGNGDLVDEFQGFQEDFGLEGVNGFPISQTALQTAKRKIKNVIKLDTNIQIKLDINDPEKSASFIEKGYDEERGMHYYKVFFNKERN